MQIKLRALRRKAIERLRYEERYICREQKGFVETNDDARETAITAIVKSNLRLQCWSLCDYKGAYILLKESIAILGEGADAAAVQAGERNKQAILKNCEPFTDCIS